jgi:hypothetical protein
MIEVSSANSTTEVLVGPKYRRKEGKPFIYIKNNRGPNIDPCGTPFFNFSPFRKCVIKFNLLISVF